MIEQDLGDLAPRLDVAWATAQDFLAQALCFQVQALDLAVDSGSEEALAEDLASEEAEDGVEVDSVASGDILILR